MWRYSITNCLLIKKYVPAQERAPCNCPEFTELHGQNQNICRPYLRHCAQTHFARLSATGARISNVEVV